MAAWSALSMLWAAGPDLAWIDANRAALSACARSPSACPSGRSCRGRRSGWGSASRPPRSAVAIALGVRSCRARSDRDRDLARLAEPVGYWNALALVAAMAVPGLLWLAGGEERWGPGRRRGAQPGIVTVLLTYSRGGILALGMAAGVTVAFLPRRTAPLMVLAAAADRGGLAGCVRAVQPAAERRPRADGPARGGRRAAWDGAGLGARAGGRAGPGLAWAAGRTGLDRVRRAHRAARGPGRARRGGGAAAATPGARGWAGDRVSEFRGEGGDAVANDPGRLVNTSGNQRKAWWGEAWRGFRDAPLLGQGAGGFALVHLKERRTGDDALDTREPHDVRAAVPLGARPAGRRPAGAAVGGGVGGGPRGGALSRARDRAAPGDPRGVRPPGAVNWSWAIRRSRCRPSPPRGSCWPAPGGARPRRGGRARSPRRSAGRPGRARRGERRPSLVVGADRGRTDATRWPTGGPATALDLARWAEASNPLALGPVLLLRGRALGPAAREPCPCPRRLQRATRLQPDDPPRGGRWRSSWGGPPGRAAWRQVRRLDPSDPEAALRAG